uniref:CCHC-type domain-containing protein n=1 Tax=Podarcis muralis TaxID=64176 RepID=A0A670KBY4_PODMU
MKPCRPGEDSDTPLQFVLFSWKELRGRKGLSKSKLRDLCNVSWVAFTHHLEPASRWPPHGSFNIVRIQALKTYLADEKPPRDLFQQQQARIVRQMAIRAQEEQLDRSLIPFYYPEPQAPQPSGSGTGAGGGGVGLRENATNATTAPSQILPNAQPPNSSTSTPNPRGDEVDLDLGPLLNGQLLNGDREGPVSSRTRNRDIPSNGEAEGAYPLRALPIPPVRAGDPPRMVFTHQPFLTSDLMNWSDKMPSLRDDPDKCHRQVATIFSTHNPTWADVHMLLGALFNEAEKREILAKAGEALTREGYQPNRPASMTPLTAQTILNDLDWDYNTDNGVWGLKIFKKAILDGIKAAGQRTVNWTKVQTVLQGAEEHPSDYYSRLVSAIKTWGGIDPENPQHEVIVKGFFKDQATADIRKALNSHLGYDGKTLTEILSIAKSVFNSRDERRKKDQKPDSPRVLAYAGGVSPYKNKQWGPESRDNRTCYKCGQKGHVRKFCPFLTDTTEPENQNCNGTGRNSPELPPFQTSKRLGWTPICKPYFPTNL